MINEIRKKVIFIVGTSFSGSTLIGSLIQHPEISFLSEVDRFKLFSRHDENYLIDGCSVCGAEDHAATCPIFGFDRKIAIENKKDIVAKYLEMIAPCGSIIIDSSKSVDWLKTLFDAGLQSHVDIYVIFSCRNPVAYAFSATAANRQPFWENVISWREFHEHALRTLMHRSIPFIPIRYESIFVVGNLFAEKISNLICEKVAFSQHKNVTFTHALGGNFGVYLANKQFKKKKIPKQLTEFSVGDAWKVDFYKNKSIVESTRWTTIGKATAMDLLMLPNILNVGSLFGYSIENILYYFKQN